LLFVRQRSTGAYLRMATDPDAFLPCTQAIFSNSDLVRRLDPRRLSQLRRGTEAENDWIIGRESIRHGQWGNGLSRLRRSFRVRPSLKRGILLLIAHLLPMLPAKLSGPFRPYR
jgi:hypothetical protein